METPARTDGWTHRISTSYSFSASHRLERLPQDHKCSRLHGHTYTAEITIEGSLDGVGFVLDFGDLAWVGELIQSELDHRHLNDALPTNPTSENIASWLGRRVDDWLNARSDSARFTGFGVTVSESPRTQAALWVRR